MKAKIIKTVIIIVVALIAVFIVRLIKLGKESQSMKVTLGLTSSNTLLPCISTSNCYAGNIDAQENLIPKTLAIIREMGMEVATSSEFYFHSTAKSALFGFVDDVEFFYNAEEKKLYFRSASRVGKSDLGANKKRIEKILQ